MRKCMLCSWEENDDSKFTCPACGECTWCPIEAPAEEVVEEAPAEEAPKRRTRKS